VGLFRKHTEADNEMAALIAEAEKRGAADDAQTAAQAYSEVDAEDLDDDFEDLQNGQAGEAGESAGSVGAGLDGEDDDFEFDDEVGEDNLRADGPFDIEEVDLDDGVTRIDLGALVVTPVPDFGLQLLADQKTKAVKAITVTWKQSAMEVSVIAAATSGGTAAELAEDITVVAENAGGSVEEEEGPFGLQLKRVVPVKKEGKEQLYHVSRIWLVEGPRWVLQATVLGAAAISEDDSTLTVPFAEFLRNLVVRRGELPVAPTDIVPMSLPSEE
jgi:hypothetical protein